MAELAQLLQTITDGQRADRERTEGLVQALALQQQQQTNVMTEALNRVATSTSAAASGAPVVTGKVQQNMDLTKLGKIDPFKGKEEQWQEFSFSFKSFIALMSEDMKDRMDEVEQEKTPVTLDAMTEDGRRAARQLFYMLTTLTKNQPNKLVRNLRDTSNGMEAWRSLYQRYGRADMQGKMGTLSTILTYNFGAKIAEVEEKLLSWKSMIEDYDNLPDANVIEDDVKKAVMCSNLPEPLRGHMQLNISNYPKANDMLKGAVTYVRTRTGANFAQQQQKTDPDAMDVDGFFKGKKGNKGSGKDGGKGKTDATCHKCGKKGHYAKDCYSKTMKGDKGKDGSKKGSGKTDGGKGKGETCANCGKTGHAAKDCWSKPKSVSELEREKQQPEQEPGKIAGFYRNDESDDPWIFNFERETVSHGLMQYGIVGCLLLGLLITIGFIFTFKPNSLLNAFACQDSELYLLVDSGSFEHVAPLDFAPHIPLRQSGGVLASPASAGAAKLVCHGKKIVPMTLYDANYSYEVKANITFLIYDVKRPMLSTSRMRKNGIGVNFPSNGGPATLEKNGDFRRMRLVDYNDVTFVKAKFEYEKYENPICPLVVGGSSGSGTQVPVIEDDEVILPDAEEPRDIPAVDVGDAEDQGPTVRGISLRAPPEPSEAERREHELLHIPFRSWCRVCVEAKGKDNDHTKQTAEKRLEGHPVIQFDFTFL